MGRKFYDSTPYLFKGLLHSLSLWAGTTKSVWLGRGCKADMTRLLDPLPTFCTAFMAKFADRTHCS